MMKGVVRKIGEKAAKVQKDLPIPDVKPGHVLVKNEFCGINFIDVYFRDGLYPIADGAVLGAEAGGVVYDCEDILKKDWLNRRVVFSGMGAFAEYTSVPLSKLVKVPDDVSMQNALALTTMGLTAHYLCSSVGKLKKGDHVLVHAAGSGTGNLIAQVASNIFEANVVATASSSKVKNIPRSCKAAVDYTGFPENLANQLRELTPEKRGFDVVFDGVGKDTAALSLNSCRPRGLVVYFGNASGPVPPIDPLQLSAKGSLFLTRPKLQDYISTPEELSERANDVFQWLRTGRISVAHDKEYASLESVNEALDYVKGGQATGKVVVKL